ncbi:MAG: DUF362 domain-containing protein [Lentisphaeria bacterium]|jgi:uncharacterized protein (DUF362 family)/NAD-dependent dihydropyrimidine dehydrogenase PreA subunit
MPDTSTTTVSIIPLDSYDDPALVLAALREGLRPFGGMAGIVQPGQRVLLKPNLVAPSKPQLAVTTHPEILRAVIRLVKEAGGIVGVGDGPGVGDTRSAAKGSGLLDVIKDEGAELRDFSDTHTFYNEHNRLAKRIDLTSHLLDSDVLITLPKLKTHAQMAYTGALKNQFGLIPGSAKGQFHFRFQNRDHLADLMVDINRTAKPALAVMDAVIGMEGPGPSGGTPRKIGALVVGTDLTAVDVVCCALIGLSSHSVPITNAARRADYGVCDLERITIHGAGIESMRVPDFDLVRAPSNIMRILPLPRFLLRWLRRQIAPKPVIISDRCIHCGRCRDGCPVAPSAINPMLPPKQSLNDRSCIRCYCCHEFCPVKAIDLKRSFLDRVLHLNALGDFGARMFGRLVVYFDWRNLRHRRRRKP